MIITKIASQKCYFRAKDLAYSQVPRLAPKIPSRSLYHLIKKPVAIHKHLERNRRIRTKKFRLILVESRIHKLTRYYKRTKKLPSVWK
ncbi:hypothetical protein IFM89_021420 [Coptis chinensis]|uniref:Ribosomal protein S15 n=1 Tax=Coptis chinensis TaxID=261450 RepID=A0A835I5W2_9MAGN|nr:hypothetical protein IFM89_021420 [Coptis chinensis]